MPQFLETKGWPSAGKRLIYTAMGDVTQNDNHLLQRFGIFQSAGIFTCGFGNPGGKECNTEYVTGKKLFPKHRHFYLAAGRSFMDADGPRRAAGPARSAVVSFDLSQRVSDSPAGAFNQSIPINNLLLTVVGRRAAGNSFGADPGRAPRHIYIPVHAFLP